MSLDPLTLWFLVGVGVVLLLVVLAAVLMILTARRRRRRVLRLRVEHLGDQPYLLSQEVSKRRHSLLRRLEDEVEPGTEVPVMFPDPDGGQSRRMLRVSRTGRRPAADGRVAVAAYLEPFEGSELPVTLPVAGERGVSKLVFDDAGVHGFDDAGALRFEAAWRGLEFLDDGRLHLFGPDTALSIDTTRGNGAYARDLAVKYARLQPPHRRRAGEAKERARSLDEVHPEA